MIKNICFIILSIFFANQALAKQDDTVLKWVETQSKNSKSDVENSWNPGFLVFDETELRMGFANEKALRKESVRFSLKPLFGLANEYKLSSQRTKLSKLKIQNSKQEGRLFAYIQVLEVWRLLKSLEVVHKSRSVFDKVNKSLRSNGMDTRLGANSAKVVMNLSNYMSMKATLEKAYQERVNQLITSKVTAEKLFSDISKMNLLSFPKLLRKINSNESKTVAVNLELAESELNYFEFQQKKKEAYQLIKFVSVEREEDKNSNNIYSAQVSLRIPFLSDSEELRRAKTDYVVAQNNLARTQAREKSELSRIRSEITGLVDKSNILKLLPAKSHAHQMMSNNVTSIFDATNNEFDFLKAKLDSVETKAKIYEQYLYYLAKVGKLDNAKLNYLTEL